MSTSQERRIGLAIGIISASFMLLAASLFIQSMDNDIYLLHQDIVNSYRHPTPPERHPFTHLNPIFLRLYGGGMMIFLNNVNYGECVVLLCYPHGEKITPSAITVNGHAYHGNIAACSLKLNSIIYTLDKRQLGIESKQ